MPDRSSFPERSSVEPDAMSAIAAEAQSMVMEAAQPVEPGETVKAQMNRAARNLRYVRGDWRIKAAWYLEAGCWGAATFRDLQERYAVWRERQEAKTNARTADAVAALRVLRSAYAAVDPDMFGPEMDALEQVIRDASGDQAALGARRGAGTLSEADEG